MNFQYTFSSFVCLFVFSQIVLVLIPWFLLIFFVPLMLFIVNFKRTLTRFEHTKHLITFKYQLVLAISLYFYAFTFDHYRNKTNRFLLEVTQVHFTTSYDTHIFRLFIACLFLYSTWPLRRKDSTRFSMMSMHIRLIQFEPHTINRSWFC